MSLVIKASASCKLNLYLQVLGLREDGFHALESIFQQISLADELILSRTTKQNENTVFCTNFELPIQNTLSKTIAIFREKTKIKDGVSVRLTKKVPVGAGLGGGSSDAACLLRSLDTMFSTNLSENDMITLSSQIGSDVPFFIKGGTAIVKGRGEHVYALPSRTDLYGVLVWPEIFVSTAEAFKMVDLWQEENHGVSQLFSDNEALIKVYKGPLSQWGFVNSFEPPLFRKYPQIGELKDTMYRLGADFSAMTGSGSTVFGLFLDQDRAQKAFLELKKLWSSCYQFLLLASSTMQ